MHELWQLIADQVYDRVSGPMKFRIALQPLVATFLAIRWGLIDAKIGAPPYFWSLITNPENRAARIKEGWKSIARLFFLAMALDIVYQILSRIPFICGRLFWSPSYWRSCPSCYCEE